MNYEYALHEDTTSLPCAAGKALGCVRSPYIQKQRCIKRRASNTHRLQHSPTGFHPQGSALPLFPSLLCYLDPSSIPYRQCTVPYPSPSHNSSHDLHPKPQSMEISITARLFIYPYAALYSSLSSLSFTIPLQMGLSEPVPH